MLEDAWWSDYKGISPQELYCLWGILAHVLLMSPIYQLSAMSPYKSVCHTTSRIFEGEFN